MMLVFLRVVLGSSGSGRSNDLTAEKLVLLQRRLIVCLEAQLDSLGVSSEFSCLGTEIATIVFGLGG